MRRRRRRRFSNKRKRKALKIYIFLFIVFTAVTGLYFAADAMLGPVLEEVAGVRVKELVAESINSAVIEVMEESPKEDFLNFTADENGYISMVSANTAYMNEFSSRMTEAIHDNISEIEGEKVRLPLGTIAGSSLLSQVGPSVNLKIEPIGNASINFTTEFESGGINQTKYKVYMEVVGKVKPVVPFVKEEYEVNTVVPVAETVIVGKVPETYLTLPLTEK